jgi:hypothetical protein
MHKPSGLWYALGALIIIGGLVASVNGALRDVAALQADFVRFIAPGTTDLHVRTPGQYVVYYERKSVVEGDSFATAPTTDIKCAVTSKQSGSAVALEPPTLDAEYDFGGKAGKAIEQFFAPQMGTYVITCGYPGGKGARIALAIAPPVAPDLASALLKWLAISFACIGIGMVVLIVTLVRRAGPPPRPTPA